MGKNKKERSPLTIPHDALDDRTTVQTTYTNRGEVGKVSNPYLRGGSPTDWTRYSYDGLDRLIEVEAPDGIKTTLDHSLAAWPGHLRSGRSKRMPGSGPGKMMGRRCAHGPLRTMVSP